MKEFFNDQRNKNRILLILISALIIFISYESVINFSKLSKTASELFTYLVKLTAPIITGMVIAYLLYRPITKLAKFFEDKVFKNKKKTSKVVSTLLIHLIALILVVLLLYSLLPSIAESIMTIISKAPDYSESISNIITKISKTDLYKDLSKLFKNDFLSKDSLKEIGEKLSKLLESFGTTLLNIAVSVGKFFYNFLFGFVFSIYINLSSEELFSQARKLFKAILGKSYSRVCEYTDYADKMFFGYLAGKLSASVILGVVAYIVCAVFGVRYAFLTAVIICFTNLIPIIGPWIGGVPCILLAMVDGLRYSIIVAIMVIILQMIDMNYLSPKFISDKVDLSGFWILVSILVCGDFWGIIGTVIAIPLFAVLKKFVSELINNKLEKMNINEEELIKEK